MIPSSSPPSLPPNAVNRVVLELPDGPNMANISPGRTLPVTSFKIIFSSVLVIFPQKPDFVNLTL